MVTIECKLKRFGDSLGLVIPIEIINKENIKEGDILRLIILKDSKKAFTGTFGMFKGKLKKTGQEFKDECRRDLYND